MISMIFEGNSREVIALLSKLNDSRFRVANALMAKDYNGLKVESSKGTERMSLFVMNKEDTEVFLTDCDLPTLKIGENKTYDGLMFELKPFLENIRKTLPSLSVSVAILYKVDGVERWSFAYTYVPNEVFSIVENTSFERKSKKEVVKVPYSFKCEICGEDNSLNMNADSEKVFCSSCGKEHLVSNKINLNKEDKIVEEKSTADEKGMTVACPTCGEEITIGVSLLKSMSSNCNLKCKKCGNKYVVKNPYVQGFEVKMNNILNDIGLSEDVKDKVFNEFGKAKEEIKSVLPKSAEETLDSVIDALNECFGLKIDRDTMPKMPEDLRTFFRDLLD